MLNFAYIHSKRRKLDMFILFQRYQSVYRNKVNSPPIRQFPSVSIFGHLTCHVTIIRREDTRKPEDLLLGKSSFFSRSPSERYCQFFICSAHIFDPGLKPLECMPKLQPINHFLQVNPLVPGLKLLEQHFFYFNLLPHKRCFLTSRPTHAVVIKNLKIE